MIKPGRSLSTILRRLVNDSSRATSRCVLCLAPARPGRLCDGCEADLPLIGSACATCALPLPFPATACGRCQKWPPDFDRTRVPLPYRFPVAAMISRFKYQGDLSMVKPLVPLLAEHIRQQADPLPDLILPCPIHFRRLRGRGFNQAAVIAAALGKQLNIPVDYRLWRRIRSTPPQTGLDRAARLRNLKHAFGLEAQPPPAVAIVDDVVTTGATSEQLATLLKQAGAKDVSIWALARTPLF